MWVGERFYDYNKVYIIAVTMQPDKKIVNNYALPGITLVKPVI